jgi:hypothetical protein
MPNYSQSAGVKIWWDLQVQAYRMVTPYNATFVEAIKKLLPASDREWDPNTKMWTFVEKYLDPMILLVEQQFHCTATVLRRIDAERASTPPSRVVNSKMDTLITQFFKLLPFDAVEKAYKVAALTLHPDRGGDMSKMSELNAMWDRIRKEHFQK